MPVVPPVEVHSPAYERQGDLQIWELQPGNLRDERRRRKKQMFYPASRQPPTVALRHTLDQVQRHAPQMAPIHHHLEGVVARSPEGDAA